MATTKAHQTVTATVNNGGTLLGAGNIGSDSAITVNKSLVEVADGGDDYGSKVVKKNNPSSLDHAGVIEAKGLNNGTLAFFPNAQEGERNFLVRGIGTEDGNGEINNSASTVLLNGASEVQLRAVNTVHKTVKTQQVGEYADRSFDVLAKPSKDMVPGRTLGTDAGTDSNFVQTDGATAASDDAASSTRAVPGELTYHFGGLAVPATDEYKARDSYEA